MAFIGNTNTTQAFTPAVDFFSGNGSTTAFTLSRPVASVAQVQVTIDNVAQNPSSAYTVSANTITFTSAPLSGTNNVYVYYTSPITQVIAPGQGTVTATSMASSTGTGAGVFQTSPTITTPTISSLSSASATALTLQSAGTTAITVDTSQNVAVGNTSPQAKLAVGAGTTAPGFGTASKMLYVCDTTQPEILIRETGGSVVTSMYSDSSTGNIRTATNHPLVFQTNNSERMRIVSSGELVVGGTTAGGVGTSIAAPDSGGIYLNTATTGLRNAIRFVNPNGTVGSIQTNGSSTAYNTSSDYRLKENIAPMTGALAKVALLKPVTYKWKVDGAIGEGFIAHELAEVCSHAVSGAKDAVDENGNPEYQGIDVSFLVATLTAAIQELKAINDTQTETINALTARIEALENR